MNINEAKKTISTILKANPHQSIMVWGPPGVGKSQMIEQVAADLGRSMIDLRLSQMDPPDLRGIPSVVEGRTVFHPPSELPQNPNDLLLLGELNAAPRAVMAAAMQLVLDRGLGSYRLPEGVPVLADGNRVADQAVANRMPSALNNRFIHVTVEPDMGSMVKYALDKQWPMELVQFLRFRPNLLHSMPSPLRDGEAFPSPRSWEYVVQSKALQVPEADTRRFMLMGAVGAGAMTELEAFIRTFRNLPNLDQVLADPRNAHLPTDTGTKYAVAGALANKANAANISSIMVYLQRFPEKEYAAMAVNAILKNKAELQSSSELVRWMADNRAA